MKTIEQLKKFFQVTVHSFKYGEGIIKIMNSEPHPKVIEMRKLHEEALNILENPEGRTEEEILKTIDGMLLKMELLSSTPIAPAFPSGGMMNN